MKAKLQTILQQNKYTYMLYLQVSIMLSLKNVLVKLVCVFVLRNKGNTSYNVCVFSIINTIKHI